MPYIHIKSNISITKDSRETIKSALGKAISLIPGKSETWLMCEIEGDKNLYFAGDNNAPCAYNEVKIFGNADEKSCSALTGEICNILNDVLGIEKNKIYVKYEMCSVWGWNGSNF